MKLTLKNFKCYRKHTFSFPNKTFVLIRGRNGSGKSTLFKAYSHALYGREKNPYSRGTTTCKVILEDVDPSGNPYTIIRRNHPNVLQLKYHGQVYQDDEAQEIIGSFMGMNYESFIAACCVYDQDGSLLNMTPSARLKFIQSLTDYHDRSYQKKITELVHDYQTQTKTLEREVSIRKETCALLKSKLSLVKPQKPTRTQDQCQMEHEAMTQEIRKCQEQIQHLQQDHQKAQQWQDDQGRLLQWTTESQLITTALRAMNGEMSLLREQCAELESVETMIQTLKHSKQYHHLKTQLDALEAEAPTPSPWILSQEQCQKIQQTLRQVTLLDQQHQTYQSWKRQYDSCFQLWSDLESKLHLDLNLSSMLNQVHIDALEEKLHASLNQIRKLDVHIHDAEKKLQAYQTSELALTCPSCHASLQLKNQQLMMVSHDHSTHDAKLKLEQDVKTWTSTKMKLKKWIMHEGWIRHVLKTTRELLALDIVPEPPPQLHVGDMEDQWRKHTIHTDIYQRDLMAHDQNIKQLKASLKALGEYTTSWNEQEYRALKEKRTILQAAHHQYRTLEKEYSAQSQRLQQMNASIETLSAKWPTSYSITSIQQALDKTRETLDHYRQTRVSIEDDQRQWVTYIDDRQKRKEYIHEKSKLDAVQTQRLSAQRKWEGLQGVLDTCKEAEILATQHLIHELNEYLQYHLDRLFDGELVVSMEGYKKHATKQEYKPSMNIVSELCGQPLKDLSSDLSGGQFQLCVLAFRLAIGDVLGRRILFLDESLNKLDPETHQTFLTYLKSLTMDPDRPLQVMIISHHSIDGSFDEVIVLE